MILSSYSKCEFTGQLPWSLSLENLVTPAKNSLEYDLWSFLHFLCKSAMVELFYIH